MGRILRGKLLEEFKKEFEVDADFIIIKIDKEHKLASYIVDATMKITADYEKILKYYNR